MVALRIAPVLARHRLVLVLHAVARLYERRGDPHVHGRVEALLARTLLVVVVAVLHVGGGVGHVRPLARRPIVDRPVKVRIERLIKGGLALPALAMGLVRRDPDPEHGLVELHAARLQRRIALAHDLALRGIVPEAFARRLALVGVRHRGKRRRDTEAVVGLVLDHARDVERHVLLRRVRGQRLVGVPQRHLEEAARGGLGALAARGDSDEARIRRRLALLAIRRALTAAQPPAAVDVTN